MRRFLVLLAVILGSLAPPAAALAAPSCAFRLGFAALANLIPDQTGQCLTDERHNPVSGDATQPTSTGLLVWRKADNWTAFTDGYRTWIDGPDGLSVRLNTQRFPWEADATGYAPAPAPTLARFVDALGNEWSLAYPADWTLGPEYPGDAATAYTHWRLGNGVTAVYVVGESATTIPNAGRTSAAQALAGFAPGSNGGPCSPATSALAVSIAGQPAARVDGPDCAILQFVAPGHGLWLAGVGDMASVDALFASVRLTWQAR